MKTTMTFIAAGLLASGAALAQPTRSGARPHHDARGARRWIRAKTSPTSPARWTREQLMSSTRSLFAQNSANVFRRFPPDKTAEMVKFYTQALALKSLNPIQLTSTQQMLLTGVGSGQIKLSAGQQGNRKYHLDGGYKAAPASAISG